MERFISDLFFSYEKQSKAKAHYITCTQRNTMQSLTNFEDYVNVERFKSENTRFKITTIVLVTVHNPYEKRLEAPIAKSISRA